jgi:hypothetical protein
MQHLLWKTIVDAHKRESYTIATFQILIVPDWRNYIMVHFRKQLKTLKFLFESNECNQSSCQKPSTDHLHSENDYKNVSSYILSACV